VPRSKYGFYAKVAVAEQERMHAMIAECGKLRKALRAPPAGARIESERLKRKAYACTAPKSPAGPADGAGSSGQLYALNRRRSGTAIITPTVRRNAIEEGSGMGAVMAPYRNASLLPPS
jgi:hypothetical protein